MRHWIFHLLILTALLPAAGWAQNKIGYVDWKRLVESAPQITVARDKLDAEFRPRNAAIESNDQRLRDLEERLQRDSAIMSAQEVRGLEQQIRGLRRDLQRDREDLADELDFRLSEERQRVEDEIYEIVRQFAIENGFDLIVPGPALYASDSVDLTDDLLTRLRTDLDNGSTATDQD